jgi:hypothetical protein
MNLRLSKSQLRFRISKDELVLLQNNKILKEELELPNSLISFGIAISESEETFFEDQNFLLLKISEADLKTLEDNFPSKDGMEKEVQLKSGKSLLISLEVDVMKRKS